MKRIITALLILAASGAYAQGLPDLPEQITPTTTMQITLAQKLCIVTSDEQLAKQIIKHYMQCECITFSFRFHKGSQEWTINLPADKRDEIITAIKPKA